MPTPPPRDAAGIVEPHDHPEIGADDGVIRKISERQLVTDRHGVRRISSLAYQASGGPKGGMSVDIERFITDANVNAQTWVTTPRWIGSVRFAAGFLRGQFFKVGYDPLEQIGEQEANPYHGEVWGEFTRKQKQAVQQAAEWFVPIDGVDLA